MVASYQTIITQLAFLFSTSVVFQLALFVDLRVIFLAYGIVPIMAAVCYIFIIKDMDNEKPIPA